jgi:hypothetical protein
MTERAKTELELIAQEARENQSGVVFDVRSIINSQRSAELFVRLPEDLRSSIIQGGTTILVDYMGNTHITKSLGES